MIDVDAMQERIRTANPVPDLEQLDSDGLTRLVGLAAHPSPDVFADEPLQRQTGRRRGPVVAIATAAIALGAVALAVVVAVSLGGVGTQGEIAPAAIGETTTSWQVPNPALFTKRLVPHPSVSPSPLSTVIGDLEFELLQFESPAYSLWRVHWTESGLVSIANGRLYWSTDFYNWESTGPVDGDVITVVDDDVIVHGRGAAVRYSWDGSAWVEGDVMFAAGANQVVFGPSGAVAFSGGTFLYSTDGVTFNTAAQAPLSTPERGRCPEGGGWLASEPLLLATDAGYVALVPTRSAWWSADPVCESVVWFSADGSKWDLASAESPFGEESVVSHVAERGGRFVAAGADRLMPSVIWVSDDGIGWDRLDSDLHSIDGLFAGELGWVITGATADYGSQLIMFSADGITWDGPYPRPESLGTGYLPPHIAVGDDVIFGIGGGHSDVLIARLQE